MSLSRTWRVAQVLLPVALILGASCDDDDDPASTEDTVLSSELLDGRTFLSTEVSGETLAEETDLTVTFDGDRLSANAGCNTLIGGYTIDDGILTAGPLAQTMRACEDDLQRQDQWVTALLEGGPTVTLIDDMLTVASDTTSVVFQES